MKATEIKNPSDLEKFIEQTVNDFMITKSRKQTIVALGEMSVRIYEMTKAEQKEKFKNIYTILDEIGFEKYIEHSASTLPIKDRVFLFRQSVFGIIQKFYDNVLNTHVEDLSVKADKEEKKVQNSDSMDILKLLKDNGYENDAVYDLIQNHIQSIAK